MIKDTVGVSPAFNVNLSSVIFSSVISGSEDYGKEYKLTLKDTGFGIAVTDGSAVAASGTTVYVPYTVTDTDENLDPDTVSVLIQSTDNTILYYEPLSGTYATNGTGTFELPSTLELDGWGTSYTVSILAEDVNEKMETDYASVPVALSKPVPAHTVTLHTNDGTINIAASDDAINAGYKSAKISPTAEFNGGYVTIVMGSGDTDAVDSNGNLIITGGTLDITAQSPFDYDGVCQKTGGTLIVNGTETDTISNQMMGGGMGGRKGR